MLKRGSQKVRGIALDTYYLKAKHLIDGTGTPPIDNGAIIVEGELISQVGSQVSLAVPTGARVIDFGQRTVLPGMIDAHVHLRGRRLGGPGTEFEWLTASEGLMAIRAAMDAGELLQVGFTSARDMGSIYGPALKKAVLEGTISGPRLIAARQMITQTGGHGAPQSLPPDMITNRWHYCIVDGVDAVRRGVREQLRGGADVIKICATGDVATEVTDWKLAQFTLEEIQAAVEEARRANRKVAAHAEGIEGVRAAVEAGVDTIEHGCWLDEEICRRMEDHGTILVPTLRVMEELAVAGTSSGRPDWVVRKAAEVYEVQKRTFHLALSHKIRIAMGSDSSGYYLKHNRGAQELVSMARAGMTNMQALVAATRTAAEALGIEKEVGTLEPRKFADIIVADGDPLIDIGVLQRAIFVMKGGKVFHDDDSAAVKEVAK